MSVLEAAVRRRADTGTICSVGFGHRDREKTPEGRRVLLTGQK